ncbi:unnamed protein product [Cuscuta campestris]|uniref:Uncharacterized protein n=1 Tax=Cuscuta campestris TaxID=132261 RepID=A0A484MTV9_9ASTE|nr:unnamed protein product [Cuscuta campestris]
MNSSGSDYQKFAPSPVQAPSYYGERATTGYPVDSSSSASQFYSSDGSHIAPKAAARLPWSTGLFGCFSDPSNCCLTFWCPCVTFGRIAEIVDKGSSSCGVNGALYTLMACVTGCPCLYSCFYRKKMREQYMLRDRPCGDCLLHCFCESCALCQEHRELKIRGFDMSIGWHGNVEKQNNGIVMAPIPQGGMSR